MGVIITFLLVGGIMGFGCAALYYQRQIDQIAALKRAHAYDQQTIAALEASIKHLKEYAETAKELLESWPVQKGQMQQQARNNGAFGSEQ